jgi:pilus assembly protein Flp/PilA
MEFVTYWKTWLQAHVKSEKGAALVEYALLLALIAVVCIVAIGVLGRSSSSKFSSIAGEISTAG